MISDSGLSRHERVEVKVLTKTQSDICDVVWVKSNGSSAVVKANEYPIVQI